MKFMHAISLSRLLLAKYLLIRINQFGDENETEALTFTTLVAIV